NRLTDLQRFHGTRCLRTAGATFVDGSRLYGPSVVYERSPKRLFGLRLPRSARLPANSAFSIEGPMTDATGSEPLGLRLERRRFMAALAGGLLAAPLVAEAQPRGKVWRIGFAGLLTREQIMPWFRELEAGLREHGYVPGRNLEWEIRFAAGHPEQL